MLLTLVPTTAFAADDYRPSSVNDPSHYTDVAGSWAATEMGIAIRNGIMTGTSATTATPNKRITRAEMAAFMVRVFEPTGYSDLSRFIDMSPSQWHYNIVGQAVSMGVLYGDGNQIRPDDTITKQEASVILARAFNLYGYSIDMNQFSDVNTIPSWAYDSMMRCAAAGIIRANSQRQLEPKHEITRAEFAFMLANAVTTYSSSKVYSVGSGTVKSIMVSDLQPVIRDVSVTDNIYIGDGVANSEIRLNKVNVDGTVYAMNGGSLRLVNSWVNTLVVSSTWAQDFHVDLDYDSSIEKVVVLDAGASVSLSGSIGEVAVETEATKVFLDGSNVRTVSSTVGRPSIYLDRTSVIEDNPKNLPIDCDRGTAGDLGLVYVDSSRYSIAESVQFIGYNPIRLMNSYGLTMDDFVSDLELEGTRSGEIIVYGDFYDVLTYDSERGRRVVLDGYYLPIRLRIDGVQDDFNLYVNDADQGKIPNATSGEYCTVNMLIPFDAENYTANIKLVPVRGSRYDEISIDLVLDTTVRFRTDGRR